MATSGDGCLAEATSSGVKRKAPHTATSSAPDEGAAKHARTTDASTPPPEANFISSNGQVRPPPPPDSPTTTFRPPLPENDLEPPPLPSIQPEFGESGAALSPNGMAEEEECCFFVHKVPSEIRVESGIERLAEPNTILYDRAVDIPLVGGYSDTFYVSEMGLDAVGVCWNCGGEGHTKDECLQDENKEMIHQHFIRYRNSMAPKFTNKFVVGALSSELREALGMKAGEEPPYYAWMRRFGVPPAYKDRKDVLFPGLERASNPPVFSPYARSSNVSSPFVSSPYVASPFVSSPFYAGGFNPYPYCTGYSPTGWYPYPYG